ncbi:GlsB/YeaQ/YmgE family stress response membrane protein [Calidifontibacter sp. DB0510]|uniref:GlsB/YeaQ/YmgE family stress response membrane protein n=1 Tax=Metallococcus carri TaxID=1656884 RepID=A0A967EFB9_9MICO|nr:GlsB/YeaQ/YmgE family stress response membrane protein [Metallococcus carri]NHN56491.1 GlsB/YeaQ/YmgE family stress response membrane protein [Metallococcus carri]NOP36115.1 GlsB/YeaQ/YmgE family stress response membrane protein [Calidifontibacter sp. DB2511S]
MLWNIIVWIVVGLIVGALARLVVPGKQNISVAVTIVLGILGALIGGFIAKSVLNVADNGGIQWIPLIISVIVGAALVFGYTAITSRSSRV